MTMLLQEVKTQALQITNLNNKEKAKHMSRHGCGWEDILNKAEDLYKEQMVDELERWPLACNTRESKAPPSQFTVHLSQAPPPNHRKNKDKCGKDKKDKKHDGNGNGYNGNGNINGNRYNGNGKYKNRKDKRNKDDSKAKNPKYKPPSHNEKPVRFVNDAPLYKH